MPFRFAPGYALLVALALTAYASPVFAQGDRSLLAMMTNPIVTRAVYAHERVHPYGVAPDGAVGVNAQYEQGEAPSWFIEMQRIGGDAIQAGLAGSANPDLINQGIGYLRWGFGKQQSDGSFTGSGDIYHSTSLFTESALRSILLMKEADPVKYGPVIAEFTPHAIAAVRWLHEPAIQEPGRRANKPFTHRRWVFAAIYAEAAELTGDKDWDRDAASYVHDGIKQQQPDGVDPEKGGYDVSYQTLGVLYAEKYYACSHDRELRDEVRNVISHALDWEMTHIDPDGDVELGSSTRTGVSAGRGGVTKKIDYVSLIQAFAYGAGICNRPEYAHEAARVADYLKL